MGFALQEQGKLEAIEAYNKALSHNPNYAEAYYNIGFAFKAQGKLDKAIASYKKLFHLNLIMLTHTITWVTFFKSQVQ